MPIKNWKATKYKSRNYSMWMNTLPQYRTFKENYNVTVGRVGMTSYFYMSVTKSGRQIRSSKYTNYKDAKAQAIRYMMSHPK